MQPLSPNPSLWHLSSISLQLGRIILHLLPTRPAVPCPVCGTDSSRIHSRYRRWAWDLPWASWSVQLSIHVRRFFCDSPRCPRRIFTEPFPQTLSRYARRTERARGLLLELAHSSNAETAARMAHLLGFIISPDTLLRLQRQEQMTLPSPRILGVDEFALRRGSTYGTLLVDLERHRPVDLLPDARAQSLTDWLWAHHEVKVLARDRADAYALAGRIGAPQALQVADRFHLVRNVIGALRDLLHSQRWKEAGSAEPPRPSPPPAAAQRGRAQNRGPTPLKQARWDTVQEYRQRGLSLPAIARLLGLARKTVRKYVSLDQPPVYGIRPARRTKVDPYLDYLRHRWTEGCHNARQLYRELVQRGYRGGESTVRRIVGPWRSRPAQRLVPVERAPPLHRLVLCSASRLTETERAKLQEILPLNPALAQGYYLKEQFLRLVSMRDVAALDLWIEQAVASGLRGFQILAKGFHHDYPAIKAALMMPWSTGQCEGQICRLKLIKRLGYGRAKPDLLRQRVLHRVV